MLRAMCRRNLQRTSKSLKTFLLFVNYNIGGLMSKLYILLTDSKGKHYRCESVSDACLVARYLARYQTTSPTVESNSPWAVDDFTSITKSYYNTKEVSNG